MSTTCHLNFFEQIKTDWAANQCKQKKSLIPLHACGRSDPTTQVGWAALARPLTPLEKEEGRPALPRYSFCSSFLAGDPNDPPF